MKKKILIPIIIGVIFFGYPVITIEKEIEIIQSKEPNVSYTKEGCIIGGNINSTKSPNRTDMCVQTLKFINSEIHNYEITLGIFRIPIYEKSIIMNHPGNIPNSNQ